MALFFRAWEQEGGLWTCHQGLREIDAHHNVHDAIEHLKELAAASPPAEMFLHFIDGSVRTLDTEPAE